MLTSKEIKPRRQGFLEAMILDAAANWLAG